MNRYYICDNCDHEFVAQQSMDEPFKKKCPECGKMKLYQDLTGQHSFVYQEPTTLGHQAQRNTERMGKYDLEQKRKEHARGERQKQGTWYNKEGRDLKQALSNLTTADKKHRYIMEGNI